jgi:hypothetical protein
MLPLKYISSSVPNQKHIFLQAAYMGLLDVLATFNLSCEIFWDSPLESSLPNLFGIMGFVIVIVNKSRHNAKDANKCIDSI